MNVHKYKLCILFNNNFRIYQTELEIKLLTTFIVIITLSFHCWIDVQTDTRYLY